MMSDGTVYCDMVILSHGSNVVPKGLYKQKVESVLKLPYVSDVTDGTGLWRGIQKWLGMGVQGQGGLVKRGIFIQIPENITIHLPIDPFSSGRCLRSDNMFEQFTLGYINKYGSVKFYNGIKQASESDTGEGGIWDTGFQEFVKYTGNYSSVEIDLKYGPGPVYGEYAPKTDMLNMRISFEQNPDLWNFFQSAHPSSREITAELYRINDFAGPPPPVYGRDSSGDFRKFVFEEAHVDMKEGIYLSDLLYGVSGSRWPGLSKLYEGTHLHLTLQLCDPSIEYKMAKPFYLHPPPQIKKDDLERLEYKKSILNIVWRMIKLQAVDLQYHEGTWEHAKNISSELFGDLDSHRDARTNWKIAANKSKFLHLFTNYEISNSGCRCKSKCLNGKCKVDVDCRITDVSDKTSNKVKPGRRNNRVSPYGRKQTPEDECTGQTKYQETLGGPEGRPPYAGKFTQDHVDWLIARQQAMERLSAHGENTFGGGRGGKKKLSRKKSHIKKHKQNKRKNKQNKQNKRKNKQNKKHIKHKTKRKL